MSIPDDVLKSLRKYGWSEAKEYIESHTKYTKPDRLVRVVESVIREGILVVKHSSASIQEKRDQLVRQIELVLAASDNNELMSRFRRGVSEARTSEKVFHAILRRVDDLLSRCESPQTIAWSCIFLAHTEFAEWFLEWENLKSTPVIDSMSTRIQPRHSKVSRTPDEAIYAICVTLGHQLSLLGHRYGLFDSRSHLVFDSKGISSSAGLAEQLRELAAMWDRIDRSDASCRYFGGIIAAAKPPALGPKATQALVVAYGSPPDAEIAICVASERLNRRVSEITRQLTPMATSVRSDALSSFVDNTIQRDQAVLAELVGAEEISFKQEVGGIELGDWLRGYSALRALALEYTRSSSWMETPHVVSVATVLKSLTQCGLDRESASQFLEHCTYGKSSVDLYDCPLVNIGEGNFCLSVFSACAHDAVRLVLSQCGRFDHQFDAKGTWLELKVREIFERNGIRAAELKRRVDGQDLQIDCLLVWQKNLFVIECKNYALPSETVQSKHTFWSKQEEAATQLVRQVALLEQNPKLVSESLQREVQWERVVPVVLNGMPFSLPGLHWGVNYYDLVSLQKFFDSGKVRCVNGNQSRVSDVPHKGEDVKLWKSEFPSAIDFIANIECNKFFELTVEEFIPSPLPFRISEKLAVLTSIIGRGESVFDEMVRSLHREGR